MAFLCFSRSDWCQSPAKLKSRKVSSKQWRGPIASWQPAYCGCYGRLFSTWLVYQFPFSHARQGINPCWAFVPLFFNNFPFGPRTLQVRALYALHLMLLTSVFLLGCELTWWLVMFGTLYFFLLTPVLPRLLPLWHEAFSKYAISAFQIWLPVLGNHRPIKVPLKLGFILPYFESIVGFVSIMHKVALSGKVSRGGRRCWILELPAKDEARAEH